MNDRTRSSGVRERGGPPGARASERRNDRRPIGRTEGVFSLLRLADKRVSMRAALLGFVFPCLVESSCPPLPPGAGGLQDQTVTGHGCLESVERRQNAPVVPRSSATFG